MTISRRYSMSLIGVLALFLTGCASFNMTKPAPMQSKPIAVSISTDEVSGWTDLPIGTYRVPDSQVVISGHQKGQAAGLLFGLIGVALAHGVNSGIGKDATQNAEDALKIKLTTQAEELSRTLVKSPEFANVFTLTQDSAAPKLSVITSVAATFINDTEVQPFVVLKTSLFEPGAKDPVWTTRYIVAAGTPKPLVGNDSWTLNNGESFKQALGTGLERGMKFMLTDVSRPYVRDDKKLTLAQGQFPYVKSRLQVLGYQLTEDEDTVAIVPKLGDILVFAGVNIMNRSRTTYRPAEKDDVNFKVVSEPTK